MLKQNYQSYTMKNLASIPQLQSHELKKEIALISHVLPFKTNNYVINELINWDNVPEDPIYTLNFPRAGMLKSTHLKLLGKALSSRSSYEILKNAVKKIRQELNPDSSGQSANVPLLHGRRVSGTQHKYRETVLLFPMAGQTCHAYCTFCFRWPQFCGLSQNRFVAKNGNNTAEYIKTRPNVTDLLLTGGDPMVMKASTLQDYLNPFLDAPHLKTIRIGTKSLSYWPYRYLTDNDADDILKLFERIVSSGRSLAIMANVNHPAELSTKAVERAVSRIQATGAIIRTQSPILRHINDKPEIWADLWVKQNSLNCIPYYMFVARDTGARHFFSMPLERCWQVFRQAYQRVSGLCRTVKGPIMSATPGKVQVLGVADIDDEKVMILQFIQGRNPNWTGRPFFARHDKTAEWLSDLKPALGAQKFFFENELKSSLAAPQLNPRPQLEHFPFENIASTMAG